MILLLLLLRRFSHVWLWGDPMDSSCQAPLSTGFSRQEYWSGLPVDYRITHICFLACVFSHVWLFVTPWTIACLAHLSMGFFRQEYWSGLPVLTPGDLPNPGIKLTSLVFPTLVSGFFTISTTWEAHRITQQCKEHGAGTWEWSQTHIWLLQIQKGLRVLVGSIRSTKCPGQSVTGSEPVLNEWWLSKLQNQWQPGKILGGMSLHPSTTLLSISFFGHTVRLGLASS